jgi:hypothetical protein
MFIVPGFVYKLMENRVGRIVAYTLLFAAVFGVIVMIIFHLNATTGN